MDNRLQLPAVQKLIKQLQVLQDKFKALDVSCLFIVSSDRPTDSYQKSVIAYYGDSQANTPQEYARMLQDLLTYKQQLDNEHGPT